MNTQEGVTPQSVEAHTLEEITEMFRTLIAVVATKADLEGFARKEDLEQFATKADLEKFPTKEDVKRFATKEDLERFATKDDMKHMIAESEYRLKDHVSREVLKMRDIAYAQDLRKRS